jgi:hypothetical protein
LIKLEKLSQKLKNLLLNLKRTATTNDKASKNLRPEYQRKNQEDQKRTTKQTKKEAKKQDVNRQVKFI